MVVVVEDGRDHPPRLPQRLYKHVVIHHEIPLVAFHFQLHLFIVFLDEFLLLLGVIDPPNEACVDAFSQIAFKRTDDIVIDAN